MPAIINSAPDCIVHKQGYSGDDVADFIVNNNYQDCAGIMTFGPGSTYGDDGVGGATAYLTLTWIGIVVMVIVFLGWIWYENQRLTAFVKTGRVPIGDVESAPPSPGI